MLNIIVVSPDRYADIGRRLAHKLSEKKDTKAVFNSLKQYGDNEHQLAQSQHLVLLGGSEENEFSRAYHPLVKNWKNNGGAYTGYDGNKYFIYGDGEKTEENTAALAKHAEDDSNEDSVLWTILGVSLYAFLYPITIPATIIMLYIGHLNTAKYKKLQVAKGADFLVNKAFDKWIKADKKG